MPNFTRDLAVTQCCTRRYNKKASEAAAAAAAMAPQASPCCIRFPSNSSPTLPAAPYAGATGQNAAEGNNATHNTISHTTHRNPSYSSIQNLEPPLPHHPLVTRPLHLIPSPWPQRCETALKEALAGGLGGRKVLCCDTLDQTCDVMTCDV